MNQSDYFYLKRDLGLDLLLSQQNLTANWFRNGLIITLIGLTVFGFLSLNEHFINEKKPNKFKNIVKLITIIILLLGIFIFYQGYINSNNFNKLFKNINQNNNLSDFYKNYKYIGLGMIFVAFAIIIFILYI